MIRSVLLILLLLGSGRLLAHDPGARYLGNAGVAVDVCGRTVLFDALFDEDYGQYLRVPDEMEDDLMLGAPPFERVAALFVSHVHGDHFSPEPVLRYMRTRPGVRLYAPRQVADALRIAADPGEEGVFDRVVAFSIEPGEPPRAIEADGLEIDVVALPHSGGERMADIDNLVFRVTVAGSATVMHLGDAPADDEIFAAQQAHWDARPVHLALPPYWLLLEDTGRKILERRIRAARVVGVHVPAAARGQGEATREEVGADLFTDPGETRAIPGAVACD